MIKHKIFRNYYYELEKAIGNSKTILDVGCGSNSPIKYFLNPKRYHKTGIDIFLPSLEKSKEQQIFENYIHGNILNLSDIFHQKKFDVVISLDVIEHFNKADGYKLLSEMEKVAAKRLIIFTPNGYLPQSEKFGNPYQKHLSGWSSEEMKELGFKVIGINGLKWLRGESGNLKHKPTIIWEYTSLLSQFLTGKIPKYAYQLLCIKNIQQ